MFSKELDKKIKELEKNCKTNYQRAIIKDLYNVENMTTEDYLYIKRLVIAHIANVPVKKVDMIVEDKRNFSEITFVVKGKEGEADIVKHVINSGLEGENAEEILKEEEFVSFQFYGMEIGGSGINSQRDTVIQRAIKKRAEDVEKGKPMRSWEESCRENQKQKQVLPIDLRIEKNTKSPKKALEPLIDFDTLNNQQ